MLLFSSHSFLLFLPFQKKERKPPIRQLNILLPLFIIAFLGPVFHNYLLLQGVSLLPATESNIILATTPIFVAIGSFFFLKERLSYLHWIGILTSILGSYIILTNGHLLSPSIQPNEIKGILDLLGVQIIWTIYIIISADYPEKLGIKTFLFYSFFMASIQLGIIVLVSNTVTPWATLDAKDYLSLFFLSISTLFPYLWYFEGIQILGASRTVIFTNLMPVFGIIQSIIIFHEHPSSFFYIGTIVTILGIILVNSKKTTSQT